MKLGFVSAILDSWTYEEMMDFASEHGFECVEAACWPQGKAERRYAGVCHIDAEKVLTDDAYADHITEYSKEKHVEISALAFYPNTMDGNPEKRTSAVEHLKRVIQASDKLGIGMVTTFIGRDQTKTVEENLEIVREVWPPIIRLAEEKKVKIAIENCPMLFGTDQWPGGQNLMTTPVIWKKVFEILDSDYLGLDETAVEKLQAQFVREFALWADTPVCDAERMDNFYQLQQLAFLSYLMNGDTIALLPMKHQAGAPYDLRVRLIEADRVCSPDGFDRLMPCTVQGYEVQSIVQGVETDADGSGRHGDGILDM